MHYIKLLVRKPGSLDNARPFKGQPWGEDFDVMRGELDYRYSDEGTNRYINILLLFSTHPQKKVKHAVSVCVKCRAFSNQAVASFLRNGPHLNLAGNKILVNEGTGKRSFHVYNQFAREVA